MTTTDRLYVGDVGTLVQITLLDGENPLDLSGATVKNLIIRKPSGDCLTKTLAFATDGSDGVLVYSIETGVLNESGIWQFQARVTLPDGTWSSALSRVNVLQGLCNNQP